MDFEIADIFIYSNNVLKKIKIIKLLFTFVFIMLSFPKLPIKNPKDKTNALFEFRKTHCLHIKPFPAGG